MNKIEKIWSNAEKALTSLGYEMDPVKFKCVTKLTTGDFACYNSRTNTMSYLKSILTHPKIVEIVYHEACHKAERVMNDYEQTIEFRQTKGHTKDFKKIVKDLRQLTGFTEIPLAGAPVSWATNTSTFIVPDDIREVLISYNNQAQVKFEDIEFLEGPATDLDIKTNTVWIDRECLKPEMEFDLKEDLLTTALCLMLGNPENLDDLVDKELISLGLLEECVTSAEFQRSAPGKKRNIVFLGRDSYNKLDL